MTDQTPSDATADKALVDLLVEGVDVLSKGLCALSDPGISRTWGLRRRGLFDAVYAIEGSLRDNEVRDLLRVAVDLLDDARPSAKGREATRWGQRRRRIHDKIVKTLATA